MEDDRGANPDLAKSCLSLKFLFVEAFRSVLPYGVGFAAGAMVFMVLVELLPDAYEDARRPVVAVLVSATLVGMVLFQQSL